MNPRWFLVVLSSVLWSISAQSPGADSDSGERLRHIILESRHLGAHGLGYNSESLTQLSKKLSPSDISGLMELLADKDLRIGIQFALASQCEASFYTVRDAAVAHKMLFVDAEDIMRLVETFSACTVETQQRAAAMRSELRSLEEAEQRRQAQERQEKAAEDARIQRNALKLTDPKQAKELTRQGREEIFHRSVKAMGLKEDAPMTPAQKELVQRMYRTIVLGESGNRPPN